MDLNEIKTSLDSENPRDRMKAITALRNFEAEVAVPLLLTRMNDSEFTIRSFVAMGLGHKQTDEAYRALLDIVKRDRDANVRAEAANSLGKYGAVSLPILREAFQTSDHWLMRLSLFPILEEMVSSDELFDLCSLALADSDVMVKSTAIQILKRFSGTELEEAIVEKLLPFTTDHQWYLRRQAAYTLQSFECKGAMEAIARLKQDEDHRVVAATLEPLVPD